MIVDWSFKPIIALTLITLNITNFSHLLRVKCRDEFATNSRHFNNVAITIRETLREWYLATLYNFFRVIHLADWDTSHELFDSWLAFAFCEGVTLEATQRLTTPTTQLTRKTTRPPSAQEPTNVQVIPVSPTSLSVSWTCCTNNKADYVIFYTPHSTLPVNKWKRLPARCRDGFGRLIEDLPSDNTYKVCVVTSKSANNASVDFHDDNCDTVKIDNDTTAPPDYEPLDQISPCQCLCEEGGIALVQPSCSKAAIVDAFRPVSTLPPATAGECPCAVDSHGGRCPSGYYLMGKNGKKCFDINECVQQNGGCSHGCVNIPGGFYCACPHGMMRDPVDAKTCIHVAGSFDRITELLAQYLHANTKNNMKNTDISVTDGEKGKRFKATIKSGDDKELQFEWNSMPSMVRRALRWLI